MKESILNKIEEVTDDDLKSKINKILRKMEKASKIEQKYLEEDISDLLDEHEEDISEESEITEYEEIINRQRSEE